MMLDDCIEIVSGDWMEQMLMYAQREDVAAVGAKLYDERKRLVHAGFILGFGKDHIAESPFLRFPRGAIGYMGNLWYARNCQAVLSACMLVDAGRFREVGGMDEGLSGAYNGLDLCLKLRRLGLLVVWTPWAELILRGAKRGEGAAQSAREIDLLRSRWQKALEAGDPYYNPNLLPEGAGFRAKGKPGHYEAR